MAGQNVVLAFNVNDQYGAIFTSHNRSECLAITDPVDAPKTRAAALAKAGLFGCGSAVNFVNGVGRANMTLLDAQYATLK